MSATAAFNAQVKVTGAPVVMTAEAMALIATKTYQVTNTAKRIVDPATAVVIKDNGSAVAAANILSFDFLFGTVVVIPAYTPTAPITMDGAYIPTATIGEAKSVDISASGSLADVTSFDSAGSKRKLLTLIDASGSLTRLALPLDDLDGVTAGTQSIDGWMKAGTPRVLDVLWTTGSRWRLWILFKDYKVTAQVDAVVTVSVDFELCAQAGTVAGAAAGAAFSIGT